jgi:hypothetical protein
VLDLVIKHVLLVSGVIAGGVMWLRLGKLAKRFAAEDAAS